MTEGLTLITCTGDRPAAFSLCEKYILRQTYTGPLRWLVIDDGHAATAPTLGQTYMKLAPVPGPPKESFRRNLQHALQYVEPADRVVIIEDDDWYGRWWLEVVATLLNEADLVGESHAKYYHVGERKWWTHPNRHHASLCQTAFKGAEVRAKVDFILKNDPNPQTLDGGLWRRSGIPVERKRLLPVSTNVIGMKGLPGRKGLGIHHGAAELTKYTVDPLGAQLRLWLGPDADSYLGTSK